MLGRCTRTSTSPPATTSISWRPSSSRPAAPTKSVSRCDKHCGVEARNFERARRRCLVRLLWELDRRGVSEVLLESRGHGDAHDRRLIVTAQRTSQLSRSLRYQFGRPLQECLLWLPDAVAGAASAALCGGDDDYLIALGGKVDVIVV